LETLTLTWKIPSIIFRPPATIARPRAIDAYRTGAPAVQRYAAAWSRA
jgi:hypothetical protein